MKIKPISIIIALTIAIFLLGCSAQSTERPTVDKTADEQSGDQEEAEEVNHAPTAVISFDKNEGGIQDIFNLTGTKSHDPDNDNLTYEWVLPDGSIKTENAISLSFDSLGEYKVTLTVSDGKATDSDIVQIIVDKQEKIPEVEVSKEEEIMEDEEPEPEETVEEETTVEEKHDEATLGEKNAARKALDYLAYTSFSYSGLVEQLEYEGYTHEEALYGVDRCGADWNKQAAKKALDYLAYTSFSYSGLVEQLKFEGFTHEEAVYGVDRCGADWNEQAAKKAQEYLNYSSFSRNELIAQLEFEGFTQQQAEYGVQAVGY